MKIKIFIVTYNRPLLLQQNLDSLFSQIPQQTEIFIINNHSNFHTEYPVTVLHNVMQPDFATGHLSRNWNQALIMGFVNLNNPDCELLITCQDDTIWLANAFDKIHDLSQKYDFITDGLGDNLCIYKPNAVQEIGLWDERFCNIGYQEADYFLRATKINSSINDYTHGRIYQPHGLEIIRHPQPGFHDESHQKSMKFHSYTENLFKEKWGITPDNWKFPLPEKSLLPEYIYYPYFECACKNIAFNSIKI